MSIRHCRLPVLATHAALVMGLAYCQPAAAEPLPIGMDVEVEIDGRKTRIGRINAQQSSTGTDRIFGRFSVLLPGADGTPMTIPQLEKRLGQDHLNWFNKLIDVKPDNLPAGAKKRFVDPPSGGVGANPELVGGSFVADNTWADDRPWYWDERKPTPQELEPPNSDKRFVFKENLQLDKAFSGDKKGLIFLDGPLGQRGKTLTFQTFLIGDYGNKTYDVLGKGFQWQTKIDTLGVGEIIEITKDIDFTGELQKEIEDEFGKAGSKWRRAHKPDSGKSTPQAPALKLREKGPAGAVVTVQPTNGGKNIVNADGSIAHYAGSVPAGRNELMFEVPSMVNGKPVTDVIQYTGVARDPGTLYMSVFTEAGIMTAEPLGAWLLDHGYANGPELFMPDFFPEFGAEEVFYGVDMDNLLNAGRDFVQQYGFDEVFTVGSLQAILPGYFFSSTPLSYEPGRGWTGTPLPADAPVRYVAFHAASVPEAGTLSLTVLALVALSAMRRRSTLAYDLELRRH